MIFDAVGNFHRYLPVHKLFCMVADFIGAHDLETMEPGKIILVRGIQLGINEYMTRTRDEKKAEYHRKNIDIQFILSGCETVGHCEWSLGRETVSYNDDSDTGFAMGKLDFFTFRPGTFVVFFPDELHMPGVVTDEKCGSVKKAVFKIPV